MTKTILTVDDSPSIRQMVAATLRRGGYTVVEAVDGVDALARAGERADVALVLTDQNMPHMDGLTLTRSLRAQEQYARTPILMLTTESSPEMKAAGKAAGLTGWMVKPFDPKTLLAVLDKVLA
ncbi:response regulator [Variovorax sp. PvP013]|jgi:two-component system chemotaxis response regulator CheY|uniref:response regulator n=1 Tax=Variovorax sp. PvP013 TaxID=3156435 RepID=UPI003D21FBCA